MHRNNIDNAIKSLPSNSIIVNDSLYYALGIKSRKVFNIRMIYHPKIVT
jgi:hypothetical protein